MWSLWKQWCKASDISGNDEAVYHTKGVAIGEQRFSTIREANCFYIDKTYFIKEWWESNWSNSSSNSLINYLLREGNRKVKISFEKLLQGERKRKIMR